jgi:hypothetical protein
MHPNKMTTQQRARPARGNATLPRMQLTFGGTLTEAEYRRGHRLATPITSRYVGWFLLVLLMVAIAINGGFGPIVRDPAQRGVVFFPGLIVIIMAFTAPRRAASRMWRTNEHLRERVEGTASEEQLQWTSGTEPLARGWPDLHALKNDEEMALLYIDPHEVLIVPRRYFAPGDWLLFRELVTREIASRAHSR